jgi:hypothetical protein
MVQKRGQITSKKKKRGQDINRPGLAEKLLSINARSAT